MTLEYCKDPITRILFWRCGTAVKSRNGHQESTTGSPAVLHQLAFVGYTSALGLKFITRPDKPMMRLNADLG